MQDLCDTVHVVRVVRVKVFLKAQGSFLIKSASPASCDLVWGLWLLVAYTGVPRWRDRFTQYGIKVSYWGSGNPQNRDPRQKSPPETEKSVG